MGLDLQTASTWKTLRSATEKCYKFVISEAILDAVFNVFFVEMLLKASSYRRGIVLKIYILEIQELLKNYMLEEKINEYWEILGVYGVRTDI